MCYTGFSLHDGTILSAYPVRKPPVLAIRAKKWTFDEDGVFGDFAGAGKELSDRNNPTRMRFQDIIASRLNTRRAIRELVLPLLVNLQKDIDSIRQQLDAIQKSLDVKSEG